MFFGDDECRVRYLEIWWAGTKKIVENQKTFDDSFFHLMFFSSSVAQFLLICKVLTHLLPH